MTTEIEHRSAGTEQAAARAEARDGQAAHPFEAARAVADAVLYEGYSLYPYRASAPKNQLRWQFGVLVPPDYQETAEPSRQLTECLVELGARTSLQMRVRFLQLQARTVEQCVGPDRYEEVDRLQVGDDQYLPWDEGVERVVDLELPVDDVLGRETVFPFEFGGGEEVEEVEEIEEVEGVAGDRGHGAGRIRRRRRRLVGRVAVTATALATEPRAVRLRVVVENDTPWTDRGVPRQQALRGALVGAHTMLAVEGGAFVSLLDPPPWAEDEAERCRNVGTYPVLVGPEGSRDGMLSSPIVLYDHPRVAPESPGDLFDATEIDELLTFRTLTLTDEEKAEARATDERVRGLIDRVEQTSPEALSRLHGAIRSRSTVGAIGEDALPVGSRVRLRPGRRADAHDMFLDGRTATVEGTVRDVDGTTHLAVTVDDDPGADLHRWYGRFHYFTPDEVEPVDGPQ